MARRFNNSSDFITLSTSTQLRACVFGTLAAVVSRASNTSWDGIFSLRTSFDEEYLDLAPSSHATNRALWLSYGSSQAAPTIKVDATDGWVLVVVTKATGSATPRYHRYSFTTGTWTHENGAGTVANGVTPNTNMMIGRVGSDWFHGDIDVVGAWSTALSDTDVESLATSLTAWDSLSPAGMWVLDQASTSDPVNDRTGNGSNQTAITGTTVVDGSPLTSDSPEHYSVATTLTLGLGVTAAAAKHGTTTSPLSLGLGTNGGDEKTTSAATDLSLAADVTAVAAKHGLSQGDLALLLALSAAAVAHQDEHHTAATSLGLLLALAAGSTKTGGATTALGIDLEVAGFSGIPPEHHTAATALGLALAVATDAAKTVTGTTNLALALAGAAAASKSTTSTAALSVLLHTLATATKTTGVAAALDLALTLAATVGAPPVPVTPPWRTLLIPAEDRTLLVPAEDRTLRITP